MYICMYCPSRYVLYPALGTCESHARKVSREPERVEEEEEEKAQGTTRAKEGTKGQIYGMLRMCEAFDHTFKCVCVCMHRASIVLCQSDVCFWAELSVVLVRACSCTEQQYNTRTKFLALIAAMQTISSASNREEKQLPSSAFFTSFVGLYLIKSP